MILIFGGKAYEHVKVITVDPTVDPIVDPTVDPIVDTWAIVWTVSLQPG